METQKNENLRNAVRRVVDAILDGKTVYARGSKIDAIALIDGRLIGVDGLSDATATDNGTTFTTAFDLTDSEIAVWTRGETLYSPKDAEDDAKIKAVAETAPSGPVAATASAPTKIV